MLLLGTLSSQVELSRTLFRSHHLFLSILLAYWTILSRAEYPESTSLQCKQKRHFDGSLQQMFSWLAFQDSSRSFGVFKCQIYRRGSQVSQESDSLRKA